MSDKDKKRGVMTVNRLPVSTWNWLRVNHAEIETGNWKKKSADIALGPLPEGMGMWEMEPGALGIPGGCPKRQDMDREICGGMGEEFHRFMSHFCMKQRILHVPAGRKTEHPFSITYSAARMAKNHEGTNSRQETVGYGETLYIHLEKGSEACIILECDSPDAGVMSQTSDNAVREDRSGVLALETICFLEEGAVLHLVKVQRMGMGFRYLDDTAGYLMEGARLDLLRLNLGAGLAYMGGRFELFGSESALESRLGYLLRDSQKLDINDIAVHKGEKTQSVMEAGGVLMGGAEKTYRGTIDLQRGAKGGNGREQEDVLILSPGVVNKTIPLILCGEDDVEGSHGATAGRLDEAMIFYMESRGIPEHEAKKLMIRSRMEQLCARIGWENLRKSVMDYVEEVLCDDAGGR